MQGSSTHRQFTLSYLRAVVTLLVVAHHTALAYISFKPPRLPFTLPPLLWTAFPISDKGSWTGFDLLVGWNDIFFMSLMFFVSGLFVLPSLRRHGAGDFVKRRLLRLGVPFVVAAAVLAPVAYFPAFLQLGGEARLVSYAKAWLSLGLWPAGPAWFLWVLLTFDCVVAVCFAVIPQGVETVSMFWRKVGNRPALFFLALVMVSEIAYVPMAMKFGTEAWWHWGPFFVQSSRAAHYFVYFLVGVCVGGVGPEVALLQRVGRLGRRWWLWLLVSLMAFVAESAMALSGRTVAAAIVFPISCAASSLCVTAGVIRFARPAVWADSFSANAYGIYLFHYIFVIWLQYAMLQVVAPVLVKGATVLVVAVGMSWLMAALLRRNRTIARLV